MVAARRSRELVEAARTDSGTSRVVCLVQENKFIVQAIEIVTQAIEADNAKEYEKAYGLYKKSLEHFMTGVKCKRGGAGPPTPAAAS